MKQGRRFGFSAEQQLDVWRRWKAGQTLREIGRAFWQKNIPPFVAWCRVTGGLLPPSGGVRSSALTASGSGEEISRGLASGSSIRGDCQMFRASGIDREPGGRTS